MSTGLTWTSAAITHVGLARENNQDAVCARPDLGLWVVADGMGGHSNGEVASGLIVESLGRLKSQRDLSARVEFVEHSLLDVNRRLQELANTTRQTIGSTVVVLTTVAHHAALLWAGDSRLYRARGARLQQLTTDHSQAELFIAQGVLPRAEAMRLPKAQHLTRAIGAHETLRLDLEICAVLPGDRFLLCSDGLDKHVNHDEIADLMSVSTVTTCANRLIELTLARGAEDNVTVCVVECV